MDKIIVLGIGNQLMMDDGIGIYLIEEFLKQGNSTNIHYFIGESDIDYCLDLIEGASFVFILDAVLSGKLPGELSICPLDQLHVYQTMLDLSPHNLHLFQYLHQEKSKVNGYFIGVEADEIKFHIGLSHKIKIKWEHIFQDVNNTITSLLPKRSES